MLYTHVLRVVATGSMSRCLTLGVVGGMGVKDARRLTPAAATVVAGVVYDCMPVIWLGVNVVCLSASTLCWSAPVFGLDLRVCVWMCVVCSCVYSTVLCILVQNTTIYIVT